MFLNFCFCFITDICLQIDDTQRIEKVAKTLVWKQSQWYWSKFYLHELVFTEKQ